MRKVSPGAAITRLMKSVVPSSAGGANTAICPSFGLDTRYSISLASRTSWMFSVGSMERDGAREDERIEVFAQNVARFLVGHSDRRDPQDHARHGQHAKDG